MRVLKKHDQREKWVILFFAVFALIFIRYCYYGFDYFFQLDDYIQYHNYTFDGQSIGEIINKLGLLSARPLAGLADILFWKNIFAKMIIGVMLISAMYAGSACFFKSVFSRHFGTGYVFIVVYTLLPLGMEGTYWMSASTRIVTGLFFASMSLWFFDNWCENGGKLRLLLFIITQLLAYGFYEQVLAFSCTATILIALVSGKNVKHRSVWCIFSILSVGLYFAFVSSFPDSALYGGKTKIVLPFSAYYWKEYMPFVLDQIKCAFANGGFYIICKGFKRGVLLIRENTNYLYAFMTIALLFLFFSLAKRDDGKCRRKSAAIVVGVLLTIAPLAPFFFVDNAWFSIRGTVCSFCGIALVTDVLAALLFSQTRRPGEMAAILSTAMALVFCISSVSELYDYRETTKSDTAVSEAIISQLNSDAVLTKENKIAVLNLEPSYLDNVNYYWHEHIHGVTESTWALSGAVQCRAGLSFVPNISPMPKSPMYQPWNRSSMRLDNFDAVYIYNEGKIIPVTVVFSNDNWEIYTENGEYLGYTWEEAGYGYLELK